jgi:hypothetical protein
MNDIREGSIDLANQTIELEDLDDAYAKDYDSEDQTNDEQNGGMGGMDDLGMGDLGMGAPAPAMGGAPGMGVAPGMGL